MNYKKISKAESILKSQAGHDLIIPNTGNSAGEMVQVTCEEGHFEEIILEDITFTYTVVAGVGIFVINDEKVDVAAGDTIVIPPGNRMYFFGKLSMVLQTTPPYEPGKETHIRCIEREERYQVFGDWIRRNFRKEPWKDYLRAVPAKRMANGVLFFNEAGEVLLTKPVDFPRLQAPGGIIEQSESPHDTAVREVKEELGLDRSELDFLHVGYISGEQEMIEALHFYFDGGTLTDEDINSIVKEEGEVQEIRFISPGEITNENTEQAEFVKAAIEARGKTVAGYSQLL